MELPTWPEEAEVEKGSETLKYRDSELAETSSSDSNTNDDGDGANETEEEGEGGG